MYPQTVAAMLLIEVVLSSSNGFSSLHVSTLIFSFEELHSPNKINVKTKFQLNPLPPTL